ncbi:MAG: UDP-3-O-(3-hydroxymyristoyl)glucosamine N-acyltransferase [Pseudomonadales bacterium]|nr:UDP-3-O-(3-hydroxymyristoyl)glucosamine N-acyltransferase [Pseudomonadales bacterium]
MSLTLGEIARLLALELSGDPELEITGLASLLDAGVGQLAFLFNNRYASQLQQTNASAVVLRSADADSYTGSSLISENPRLTWARIATLFDPAPKPDKNIHDTAVVSSTAICNATVSVGPNAVISSGVNLAKGVVVGAGCFIGERVSIDENTRINANVSIYHDVSIGKNTIVHSGAVIGADGFGFEYDTDTATLVKIPQIYSVKIGDNVEIGAGTTIDRGALNHTRIDHGVKLDNQVQVGHGTSIGAMTAISGCTAIAGSTKIGSYCLIGGAVGIIDNIEIADQVEITAMSLVSQSIKQRGRYSSGTGLMPARLWKRNIVGFAKLAELIKRIRALEKKMKSP